MNAYFLVAPGATLEAAGGRLEEMGIAINMCRGQEQTKDKKRTVQRAGDRNEYRKVQTGGRKEMKR
eukprot:scaffold184917_cov14-Tisochrysis_lutea.AAC.2